MGQHRIPDFHLRNFGDRLYIYDRQFSAWKSDPVDPHRISSVKNRWPQQVEDFFKKIDTRSCVVMRKLIGGATIEHIERGYMAEYVGLMAWSRGARQHRAMMDAMREHLFSIEPEGVDTLNDLERTVVDTWERRRLEELAKSPDRAKMEKSPELLALFMAPSIKVTQTLASMSWNVYHGGPFICSDSPAWISSGLTYSTCRVGMPLSNNAYLVCDWHGDGHSLLHIEESERVPEWLNHMTAMYSRKEMYCSSRFARLPGMEQRLREPGRASQIVEDVSPQTTKKVSCPECRRTLDACTCWPNRNRVSFADGVMRVEVPIIGEARKP